MAKLKFGEVVWLGLGAKNIESQRKFYGEVAGYEEIDSGDGWSHYRMGGSRILELIQIGKEPPDHKKGFRPAFEVQNIKAAREELISKGVKAINEIDGGPAYGGYWCAFQDPEGNYFEIKQVVHRSTRRKIARRKGSSAKAAKRAGG